jgi:hypothetical protein
MSKKELIKKEISNYLDDVLMDAEKKNKLDFFRLEIVNHNGVMQYDFQQRDREKIY